MASLSTVVLTFLRSDESLYVFILLVSLGAGFFFRGLVSPPLRRDASSSFGLLLLFLFCRSDAAYALFSALIGAVIVSFAGRRHRNLLAFLFSFSFLAFFRCAAWFGFAQPRPLANAVQLILSLKIIAVAFEGEGGRRVRSARLLVSLTCMVSVS